MTGRLLLPEEPPLSCGEPKRPVDPTVTMTIDLAKLRQNTAILPVRLGEVLSVIPSHEATVRAYTSPYVARILV